MSSAVLLDHAVTVYPRVYGVDSLVFTLFRVKREPYMQIAYLFPELIAR